MAKKCFTADELLSYFEKDPNFIFDLKENETSLHLLTFGELEFDENENDDYDATEGLAKARLRVCHTLLNRNKSFISNGNMKRALPSLANRPILASIIELDDGTYDFHSHDVEYDKDGNVEYIEVPIGVIPESNNVTFELDKKNNKNYVVTDGWIYKSYSNKGYGILKEKKKCKVSAELCVNDLEYNAKEKRIDIKDFYFSGVTILGSEKDGTPIKEGMVGSNIVLNSLDETVATKYDNNESYEKILSLLNEMNSNIANHFDNKEEGGTTNMNNEVVTENVENKDEVTVVENSENVIINNNEEVISNEEVKDEKESEIVVNNENEEVKTVEENKDVVNYSIDMDSETYTFAVSMNDKIRALNRLIHKEYSEDECWYDVIAYDDYLVMTNSYRDKHYRQDYKYEDDKYSLVGERVKVSPKFITEEEETMIDNLRNQLDETTVELNSYKEKEEAENKKALFESKEYIQIKETDNFKELIENMDKYSYEECSKKADEMLLSFVKSDKFTFNKQEETKPVVSKISFSTNEENKDEYKPYGDLFDDENK